MSILRYKQKLLPLGNPQGGGGGNSGGGGGGGPTTTNVQNTNIPEYARPYVETMLGATQQQLFNTQQTGIGQYDASGNPATNGGYDASGNAQAGTTQITGIKGYIPYGATVQKDASGNVVYGANGQPVITNTAEDQAKAAIAGFSPMQQAAQQATANLQTPGQYQQASNLANTSAMGSLDTTGQAAQYGAAGAGYGAAGSMFGAAGAQQAGEAAQQAQRQAQMYGRQGSMMGQQAAGLAPQAQMYGAQGAGIGLQGLGYGAQGAQAGQEAAGQSSMLGMGTVGQGQQGANIGASLGQMSTNPNAVGAYMNPYLQQSLAPAQQLLNQQYGMQGAAQQGAATQAGAFGGSRNALMQGLNQQNQMLAQNQLVGNAYNTAFQQAQAQMNAANQAALSGNQQALSGYGMGLQGAQQAGQLGMQGAQTGLSGLGTALQGQQAGLAGLSQANQLYGTGISGAQAGLQGVGQQLGAGQLGLSGAQTGIQGAQAGLAGAQAGLAGVGAQQAGYGQAGQQASNLANIGGQQLGAQQSIISAQNQAGAQQQQQQQNIINQAIQNYATAQQYPQQQLSFMNAMLRGLPTQQSTTNQYQAVPSTLNQVTGLGLAGLGAYNAFGGSGGSDINLKENVVLLWRGDNGLNVYEFEYKPEFKNHALCGHGKFMGYMAHEVEKVVPEAVFVMDNGFKAVNYDMVGRAA